MRIVEYNMEHWKRGRVLREKKKKNKKFDQRIGTRVADLTKQFRPTRGCYSYVFVVPTKDVYRTLRSGLRYRSYRPIYRFTSDTDWRISLKAHIYKRQRCRGEVHRGLHSALVWLSRDLSRSNPGMRLFKMLRFTQLVQKLSNIILSERLNWNCCILSFSLQLPKVFFVQ